MKITLTNQNGSEDLDFLGIKVFNHPKPLAFAKTLWKNLSGDKHIDDSSSRAFSDSQLVFINDLTKISDFLKLTGKNNHLVKMLLDKIVAEKIVDEQKILALTDAINNDLGFQAIEEAIDWSKMISNLFAIPEETYLDRNTFLKMLEHSIWQEKCTFIFCDLDWLSVSDLKPYLNLHNFIFINHDFRNNVRLVSELEAVVFLDETNRVMLELIDLEVFVNFLSVKTSEYCSLDDLTSYLKKEVNLKNRKIFYAIETLFEQK